MNYQPVRVSIIGVRAFPSEFIGTSGAEVYTEKVIREIIKSTRNIHFQIYTKINYPSISDNPEAISVKSIFTFSSRVLETPIYSLFASIKVCFDGSSIVWYQSVGPAVFCWIPLLRGKRIVVTIHGLDWIRKKWSPVEQFLFSRLSSFVFHLHIRFCGVSRQLCSVIKSITGKEVLYMPPGLTIQPGPANRKHLDSFGLLTRRYVLYLGRLVPEKRIELLIRSWRQLQATDSHILLVIAGGHGNFPSYEKQLKRRFNDANIHWVGYVFGEEKASLLAYCSCLVLPSEIEGFPISLLEALQYTTACVVTKILLPASLAQLHNVVAFEDTSVTSLLRSIQKAIKIRRTGYSPQEKRVLQQFSWRQTAKKYIRLFRTIAA